MFISGAQALHVHAPSLVEYPQADGIEVADIRHLILGLPSVGHTAAGETFLTRDVPGLLAPSSDYSHSVIDRFGVSEPTLNMYRHRRT